MKNSIKQKPVIGVSMSMKIDTSLAFLGYPSAYVNDDYVRSIEENGGIPFPLPILENEDILEYYADTIDGLILSGGHDVDPHLYNEELDQKTGNIFPRRDTFDIALINKMLQKNKPILGICRGMQLLNAIFGGTLLQDLSLSKKRLIKHWQDQDCHMPIHKVTFQGDNFFSNLYGKELYTNSWHHQIIAKVASCFTVCGTTSDGVIEAVEDSSRKIIAVQWHPEMMTKYDKNKCNIFDAFFKECMK